ncbi:MAG TPA: septum formation initiator family protein [Actinomycetes bacterium]|nr:septum formation initiator family protein [Actinomycetes bacterium]
MATTPRSNRETPAPHLELVDDRPMWSRLTTRAVILLLVAAALVMSLAFPLREFIAQRAEIGAKQRQVSMLQERVQSLQDQQDRWKDPDFVEQQARLRLHYVFPGETGLVLLSPDDVKQAREPEIRVASKPQTPWYGALWTSVEAADESQ